MDELDQAVEVFCRNLSHDCQHGVRILYEALDNNLPLHSAGQSNIRID
jgi:hypothetical protein